MTTPSVLHKIGTPYLFDRATGLDIRLPEPFQIMQYHQRAWTGGTTDGRQLLHIERMTGNSTLIPTILADGDLDMYLASTGPAESTGFRTKGLEVAGQIGRQAVKGYLSMVTYNGRTNYLVLVATPAENYSERQVERSLEIARLMITR